MLTLNLVRARRRGQSLEVVPLNKASQERARELAGQYIAVTRSHVSRTRDELDEALEAITVHARDRKVGAGLRKLIADRCTFEAESDIDPIDLRQEVFGQASAARQALDPGQRFEPDRVLEDIAATRGIARAELERLLYVDLRSAHRLLSFDTLSADSLVELYEFGQAQAVLIRAERVTAWVRSASPASYRALFHKLKFLSLLYTIEPIDDDSPWSGGYRIAIDGPYSMFRSVTKYGLKLALVLPALRACDHWELEANVLWGKERTPLLFSASSEDIAVQKSAGLTKTGPAGSAGESRGEESSDPPQHLPDNVAALLARFRERHEAEKTLWLARPSTDILNLPGAGVCVPDLLFEHTETGVCVYLEVMGFWSRDAVWRRVELVEAGLPQQILFAVSSRLRVSEAALGEDLPSALYVYKGAMNPSMIEKHLDRLAGTGG